MKCSASTAVALAALLILTACATGNRRADKRGLMSDGFPAPSRELVVMAAERVVSEQGFAVERENTCSERGVLTTRWRTQLAPFSGQGYRERVTLTVNEIEGRANYFDVETNVIREFNMNVQAPSNPVMAEWKNPTRQADMETLITRRVEMHFLTGEASDEFRARFGVPGRRSRIDAAPQAEPVPEGRQEFDPLAPLDFGG